MELILICVNIYFFVFFGCLINYPKNSGSNNNIPLKKYEEKLNEDIIYV